MPNQKYFCPYCLKSKKGTGNCCGMKSIGLHYSARVPKVDANKKAWREFYERFLWRSPNDRVIRRMKALKMETIDNEKERDRITQKNEDKEFTIVMIESEINVSENIKHQHSDMLKFGDNLAPIHIRDIKKGQKYFVTSNIREIEQYLIPSVYIKDFEIKEIRPQSSPKGLGFWQNTETSKVFRYMAEFRVFNSKTEAELYQYIMMKDTSIYPYADRIEKLLKRNKIRDKHPEFFL